VSVKASAKGMAFNLLRFMLSPIGFIRMDTSKNRSNRTQFPMFLTLRKRQFSAASICIRLPVSLVLQAFPWAAGRQ
jgi:hypothetical protein